MRNVELPRTTLGELISYAKQKESPSVTVIDGIKADDVDEIMTVAKRLRLILFGIDDGKDACDKIAILQNSDVARRMACSLQKRCQVMMYDFAKRPKGSIVIAAMTNFASGWDVIRDDGFMIQAFDEDGNEIPTFIQTDIEEANYDSLKDLHMQTCQCYLRIGNAGARLGDELLRYSRHYFVYDGIYNETRQCYYPSGDSPQEIADRNKMEKLFRRWGFGHLRINSNDVGTGTNYAQ